MLKCYGAHVAPIVFAIGLSSAAKASPIVFTATATAGTYLFEGQSFTNVPLVVTATIDSDTPNIQPFGDNFATYVDSNGLGTITATLPTGPQTLNLNETTIDVQLNASLGFPATLYDSISVIADGSNSELASFDFEANFYLPTADFSDTDLANISALNGLAFPSPQTPLGDAYSLTLYGTDKNSNEVLNAFTGTAYPTITSAQVIVPEPNAIAMLGLMAIPLLRQRQRSSQGQFA